jgi:hypothetical protein
MTSYAMEAFFQSHSFRTMRLAATAPYDSGLFGSRSLYLRGRVLQVSGPILWLA